MRRCFSAGKVIRVIFSSNYNLCSQSFLRFRFVTDRRKDRSHCSSSTNSMFFNTICYFLLCYFNKTSWADISLFLYLTVFSIRFTIFLPSCVLQQKPSPPVAPSPAPPPHILYNPTQHMLTYTGFCPSGQTLPAYPNYPMTMQVGWSTHPAHRSKD